MTRLLFHHHTTIYKNENGDLWISAGIGLWLNELSKYFEEVGLLLFESTVKSIKHDTLLNKQKITWINLGKQGKYIDFYVKRKRIKKICKLLINKYDFLLIRGLTPMQNIIWNNVVVKNLKVFYLVRSLKQKHEWKLDISLIAFLANKIKEKKFNSILHSDELIIANSKQVAHDLELIVNCQIPFFSSNIFSNKDIKPLNIRPIQFPLKLLFVGRLVDMKGVRELIEATAQLINNHKKIVELHLVGDGLPEYILTCKKNAKLLGIDDKIFFHGWVRQGHILNLFFEKCDIMVLPSYSEGFPRVFWESALHSCPIVITPVGGVNSLLNNNEHAIFVKPKSVYDITNAILELINNPNLRRKIIKSAYQFAQNYTLEISVNELAKYVLNFKSIKNINRKLS